MIELKGKHNTAKVFTDNIDKETISQVIKLLNQSFTANSKIRIMPDCHAGKGCVVGTTMTLTDKVVPNLVGVDIGCLDKDSEILTPHGWIKISEYNGEKILIWNKLTEKAWYEHPLAYIKLPCDRFFHFHHSQGLNQMLSAEHKMFIYKGQKSRGYKTEIILAQDFVDMAKKRIKLDNYGVKTTFDIQNDGLNLNNDIIRLLVMISADGYVRYNKNRTKTYVELHFKKSRKIKRAQQLLSNAGISFSSGKAKNSSTSIYFTLPFFYDKSLKMFFNASLEELSVLCDEIYFWDGTIDEIRDQRSYTSTNKTNADIVQFALATQGIRASIYVKDNVKENWKTAYTVSATKNSIVSYNSPANIEEVPSKDGYKYCFTTSTGFFIMRRNNQISITGNCGMLATKLEETEIDMARLDTIINACVPSGFSIHDQVRTKFDEINKFIAPINTDNALKSLGTLGGGNHFIEVNRDKEGNLYLVIHSGSRHLGIEVCNFYQKKGTYAVKLSKADIKDLIIKYKNEGREKEIEAAIKKVSMSGKSKIPDALCYVSGNDFDDYIHDMNLAQKYAAKNRQTITEIIITAMRLHIVHQFDTVHNYIDTKNMILRKGSVSAKSGEKVIIPMNMKDGSLICIGKGNPDWNYSAPHGAGRIMSRSQAKNLVNFNKFKESMNGIYSTSVTESTIDEAPMVYKPMTEIIENIRDTVDVIDVIKPIYNFKAH